MTPEQEQREREAFDAWFRDKYDVPLIRNSRAESAWLARAAIRLVIIASAHTPAASAAITKLKVTGAGVSLGDMSLMKWGVGSAMPRLSSVGLDSGGSSSEPGAFRMSDPVWAYLERLPGKSAALFDWDQALSGWDRYPLFRDHFLQLTKNHATAVDCPTECGLGCPRSVINHAKTNIRAVCNEKEGPAIQLSSKQTLIYRLKQSTINGAICAALGIEHRESKYDGLPHTWRLGDFIPTAGMDFPVVLTMQDSKDALIEVVRSLCLSTPKPFVLIAPTRLHLSPVVETLLAQKDSLYIALNEDLYLGDVPRFLTCRDRSEIFAALVGQVPEPDSGGAR